MLPLTYREFTQALLNDFQVYFSHLLNESCQFFT